MVGPLSYVGGKNRLAGKIISLFPEHTTYVEPFAGGAHVFFRKTPSEVEVLNDLDCEIVNFFRICQAHYEELVRCLRFVLISRKWYRLLAQANPETLTDIQRAARFFYLQKNSFGGLVIKRNYHYGVIQRPNYNPARVPEIIEQAHKRLQHVQIEQLPYQDMLAKYDRATTLYFIDPPYYQRSLYRFNFKAEDFGELRQRLAALKGRFILSLNDHPDIRKLFADFAIRPVKLFYSAQRTNRAAYPELLITNFGIDKLAAASGRKAASLPDIGQNKMASSVAATPE